MWRSFFFYFDFQYDKKVKGNVRFDREDFEILVKTFGWYGRKIVYGILFGHS